MNNSLTISNLIYWGRHGRTGDESTIAQPFRVDIKIIFPFEKAFQTDDLCDVVDYKEIEVIVQKRIEGESKVLIETLAGIISDDVLEMFPMIQKVFVKITKTRPKSLGTPSVVVTKMRNENKTNKASFVEDFNLEDVIKGLDTVGAVSISILRDETRKILLEEAERGEYIRQPDVVGNAHVREELSSVETFSPGSLFYKLKENFEEALLNKITSLSGSENLFPTHPLRFNDMSLQLYEKGSIGITPHMDFKYSVDLICIFILKGSAKFAICKDREASSPVYLDTRPGNVILMRASGYKGSDFRPFHFLADVTEDRIVFGLRQKIK
jgi:dihydroneopterin aldolase